MRVPDPVPRLPLALRTHLTGWDPSHKTACAVHHYCFAARGRSLTDRNGFVSLRPLLKKGGARRFQGLNHSIWLDRPKVPRATGNALQRWLKATLIAHDRSEIGGKQLYFIIPGSARFPFRRLRSAGLSSSLTKDPRPEKAARADERGGSPSNTPLSQAPGSVSDFYPAEDGYSFTAGDFLTPLLQSPPHPDAVFAGSRRTSPAHFAGFPSCSVILFIL